MSNQHSTEEEEKKCYYKLLKDTTNKHHTTRQRRDTWINKPPEIKEELKCPICMEIMRDPVILNNISAHTFCRECINTWLHNHVTNPLTNKKIKGCPRLRRNLELKREIEALYIECSEINKHNVPPEMERIAKEFYDENLKHLAGDFHWTPWAKEKWKHFWDKAFPSYENLKADTLDFIDDLEKDIKVRLQVARDEVQKADPNDAETHKDIRQRLRDDVSILRCILNALVWFFNKIWKAITWPFRKIGEIIDWLFRRNTHPQYTDDNLDDSDDDCDDHTDNDCNND